LKSGTTPKPGPVRIELRLLVRHYAEGTPLPRRVGPARMITESLTPKPGIREQNRHKADIPTRRAVARTRARGHRGAAKAKQLQDCSAKELESAVGSGEE